MAHDSGGQGRCKGGPRSCTGVCSGKVCSGAAPCPPGWLAAAVATSQSSIEMSSLVTQIRNQSNGVPSALKSLLLLTGDYY